MKWIAIGNDVYLISNVDFNTLNDSNDTLIAPSGSLLKNIEKQRSDFPKETVFFEDVITMIRNKYTIRFKLEGIFCGDEFV